MKKTLLLVFLPMLLHISGSAKAQEKSPIQILTVKIEDFLKIIASEGEITSFSTTGQRKMITKGTFDNEGKSFRHEIRISKSGLKQERIRIYRKVTGSKILIADITKLNGDFFFIHYYEIKWLENNKFIRQYEEFIFDRKNYKRID